MKFIILQKRIKNYECFCTLMEFLRTNYLKDVLKLEILLNLESTEIEAMVRELGLGFLIITGKNKRSSYNSTSFITGEFVAIMAPSPIFTPVIIVAF